MYTPRELREMLHDGEVSVTFLKKDGSERNMLCTLKQEYLPGEKAGKSYTDPDDDWVTVWDIEAQGWRSFYNSKVLEVLPVVEI